MKIQTLTIIASVAVTLVSVRAQVPGAMQQVDGDQQRRQIEQSARTAYHAGDKVAEAYAGESGDTGEQVVILRKARPTYLEASADVQYLRTDNMFLSEHNRQQVDELISTVQIALAPAPYDFAGGKFAPRAGYRHQWYDFGLWGAKLDGFDTKLDTYDFNAQTAFADMRWVRARWSFDAGFDFTRLLTTSDYNEFYREYVPHWGVQRMFQPNDTATVIIGYEGDYRFSALNNAGLFIPSNYNDRTDHGILMSYTQKFGQHAALQPYYRFKYTHFTADVNRDDCLNSFGVAFYWFFTPRISARAFASYDIRQSSATGIADYRKLDTGMGLNLTFRF